MVVVSKYTKRDPKDGVSCPNFQWRFWNLRGSTKSHQKLDFGLQFIFAHLFLPEGIKNITECAISKAKILKQILIFEYFQRGTLLDIFFPCTVFKLKKTKQKHKLWKYLSKHSGVKCHLKSNCFPILPSGDNKKLCVCFIF